MTQYTRGRAFEYRVRDELKGAAYFVIRAAGSHGAVDLIGIRPSQTLFVQCKRSGVCGPKEWNGLLDISVTAGAWPIVAQLSKQRIGRGFKTIYWRLTDRKQRGKVHHEVFELEEMVA